MAGAVTVLLIQSERTSQSQPMSTAARPPAELAWPIPQGRETAVVEVLNGTDQRGLARTAARRLRSRGIDVVSYDNADSTPRTLVLVRRGNEHHARVVVRALGLGVIRSAPDSTRHVDVTVVLGTDFHPDMPLHP